MSVCSQTRLLLLISCFSLWSVEQNLAQPADSQQEQFLIISGKAAQFLRGKRTVHGQATVSHFLSKGVQIVQGQDVLVKLLAGGAEPLFDTLVLEQLRQCIVETVVRFQALIKKERFGGKLLVL